MDALHARLSTEEDTLFPIVRLAINPSSTCASVCLPKPSVSALPSYLRMHTKYANYQYIF